MDELVRRLWKREESALEQLQTQYGGLCRSVLARFLQDGQDVEEALNDVWLQLWRSIPPAAPRYLRAYVAKAARNTALHYVAYRQAQRRSVVTVLLDELAECIADPASEHPLNGIILRDTLNRFVRTLHGRERETFLRRYFFGASLGELAQAYRCPENSVSAMLYRTRKKLRDFLKKEDDGIDRS